MPNRPFSNEKKDFKLYTDKAALLLILSDEQAGKVIKAVVEHEQNNIFDKEAGTITNTFTPAFDQNSNEQRVYTVLIDSIMASNKAYMDTCKVRRIAGKTGGRPSKPKGNLNKPKGNLNKPDTDTDTDTDKDKDTDTYTDIVIVGDKPPKQRFKPPTVEDVKAYCIEKGYNLDPNAFIDYYEANGWKVGKNPMKSWQAALRTWARNGKTNGNNQQSDFDAILRKMSEGVVI